MPDVAVVETEDLNSGVVWKSHSWNFAEVVAVQNKYGGDRGDVWYLRQISAGTVDDLKRLIEILMTVALRGATVPEINQRSPLFPPCMEKTFVVHIYLDFSHFVLSSSNFERFGKTSLRLNRVLKQK